MNKLQAMRWLTVVGGLIFCAAAGRAAETNVFRAGENMLVQRTVERPLAEVRKVIDAYFSLARQSTNPAIQSLYLGSTTFDGKSYRGTFDDCRSLAPFNFITATPAGSNQTVVAMSSHLGTASQIVPQRKKLILHLDGMLIEPLKTR